MEHATILNAKKIYLIGIKGTGMSSLAVLLQKMGYEVTGSDVHEEFPSEIQLKNNNVVYFQGFKEDQIRQAKPDLVIMSTAYNDRNIEVVEAKLLRLPIIIYPEAIGEISKKLTSIAVCGSHGKTTTSAMLGTIMQANHETITLTGTVAESINNNVEKPRYFVFEADEYQNKFQYFSPANVILTNVDFDHPDYFKDEEHYAQIFSDFINRILDNNGFVVYNSDDKGASKILREPAPSSNVLSYGIDLDADYHIEKISSELNHFSVTHQGQEVFNIKLRVFGHHNILDATASAVMAKHLGFDRITIERQLEAFGGVRRRMEMYPSDKYILIDDYGHHPREIAITLEAIRNKYRNKNIVTVFHPHTFSRTKALLKDFGKAFNDSDLTLVLDIFPSARESADGKNEVHAQDLIKEIESNNCKAIYTRSIPDAADYIMKNVTAGSVVVTMGAGDAWKLHGLLQK